MLTDNLLPFDLLLPPVLIPSGKSVGDWWGLVRWEGEFLKPRIPFGIPEILEIHEIREIPAIP